VKINVSQETLFIELLFPDVQMFPKCFVFTACLYKPEDFTEFTVNLPDREVKIRHGRL